MLFNNNYFISDLHLGHEWIDKKGKSRGIIHFERTQFKTIEDHDKYIWEHLYDWSKQHQGSTLWILGDFGDINQLCYLKKLKICLKGTLNFIYGNHDISKYKSLFEQYFDNVYQYPVFLSSRIILSHEPLYPCPTGIINIHGHLHGARLDSPQYYCVSADVINYNPIGEKVINKMLAAVPKANYKFLREPYRELYLFTKPKKDVVYNNRGRIKLKQSLELFNQ